MAATAIIGGSGLFASPLFSQLARRLVETPYRPVEIGEDERLVFLQRHGRPPLPPHRINHRANLLALKQCGVRFLVAVNSTGSLIRALKPGSLVVPDDYFNPWAIPTFFDDRPEFTTPGLSAEVRRALLAAGRRLGIGLVDGGTYIQTTGPRFETRAEVRVLAGWGEIVGMTMAAEATLARELDLAYASLCLVDNYANGVAEQTVDIREVEEAQRQNSRILEKLLPAVLAELERVES
jgi:5'-methylthioadenosine phosphorylase